MDTNASRAAAAGLTHAHPVGGLVTGSIKAVTLDKGLQQISGMAVFCLSVVA